MKNKDGVLSFGEEYAFLEIYYKCTITKIYFFNLKLMNIL